MTVNVFTPPESIGSNDWAGGAAPAGGIHTGTSSIVMVDGTVFLVAHSKAEVAAKTAPESMHPVPPGAPAWVAFDIPGTAVPVVLDVNLIRGLHV